MTSQGVGYQAITHWLDRFTDAYLLEMCDFVETVLSGREPRVTGYDGRQAVAISLAAQRSVREDRPVALAEMSAAKATPA
jgi:myo-inositol 2-dehydrogenase/D-chiro-inositol 1-dehydrogenase